jgi:hypothetical protein
MFDIIIKMQYHLRFKSLFIHVRFASIFNFNNYFESNLTYSRDRTRIQL